jgi:SagB-type dehydrogenase family enzyme
LNPLFSFIEYDEGLIVEGIGTQETVKGVIAQTILVPMLPLLAKGISIDELLSAFPGVPITTVRDAVAKLCDWNFIVDANDYARGAPSIVSYVQGTFLSQGLQMSSAAAEDKLRAAQICILAPKKLARFAEILSCLLQEATIDARVVESLPGASTMSDLTVVLATPAHTQLFESAERARLSHNCGWLRLELDVLCGKFDIGPHFQAGKDSCFSCFQKIHGRSRPANGEDPSIAPHAEVCIGLACLEIVAHVAQFSHALIDREFRRFEIEEWTSDRLVYSRFPDCPVRLSVPAYTVHEIGHQALLTTASVYEDCISLDTHRPSLSWLSERATAASHSLIGESKEFRDTQQIELSATSLNLNCNVLDTLEGKRRRRTEPLALTELGGVLGLGAGLRKKNEGNVKRWTSTAGNLGSVELFVIANAVPGLARGVYFYQASEHSLACLSQGWRRDALNLIPKLLHRTSPPPDLLVVFTGAHHRLAKKYGPFAYKLLHLDAGVAFSQISAVLTCLGVSSELELDFDEDLMERTLDLHSWNEQAVAVMRLQGNVSTSDKIKSEIREDKEQDTCPTGFTGSGGFSGRSPLEIEKLLFEEARACHVSMAESCSHETGKSDEEEQAKVRLPRVTSVKMTLSKALDIRKSARGKLGPVSLGMIGVILKAAYHRDLLVWPNEPRLRMWVVAQHVHTLTPGIYRHYDENHLTRSAAEVPKGCFRKLFVQEEWSNAPCSIWISVGLPTLVSSSGSSAYRKFLFRAGAAAHTLTLGAISQGLQATIVAGVIQGEMRRLLSAHQSSEVFALACVIGGAQD